MGTTPALVITSRGMDTITIADLEVWYHVGVPDAERERAQRLAVTVRLGLDFRAAAATDDLAATINYFEIARRLAALGNGRSWKLIETVAVEIAELIQREYRPDSVTVEVKKFILPNTRHVAVQVTRPAVASGKGIFPGTLPLP